MSGEHLLITFPISSSLVESLKSNPLYATVSYYPSGSYYPSASNQAAKDATSESSEEQSSIPSSVYARTTIQMTMYLEGQDPSVTPNLKFIQAMSAGIEHMVPSLRSLVSHNPSLKIASASGVHATSIAEYVVMYALQHHHRSNVLSRIQDSRKWNREWYVPKGELSGARELRELTVGILGYGSIGRETARLLHQFGMHVVVATSTGEKSNARGFTVPHTGDPHGTVPEAWYSTKEDDKFTQFLKASDILVLCAPLTDATRHIINESSIAHLPPSSLLINVSRGPLIHQDSLIAALESGKLGGAVLDVTDPEPLPENHRLWSTRNCIVTPHIAGSGEKYADRCVELLNLNVQNLVAGRDLINVVALEKGY